MTQLENCTVLRYYARKCHNSLRNNPEERSSHLLCGGSLKSRMARLVFIRHLDCVKI